MVIQGKTWGPRVLARTTGLALAAMMFVSAVTGFVLVWDELGQTLAIAGARMLRLIPLFPEPPDRAFVGEHPMPAPFFFMNLFLHVAVPLGMVFLTVAAHGEAPRGLVAGAPDRRRASPRRNERRQAAIVHAPAALRPAAGRAITHDGDALVARGERPHR